MLNVKDEKGIVLVLALILMAVLSILAVAMVSLSRYETKFLVKERLSDAALYIADGGIEYAINELRTISTEFRGPETHSVGNVGQFSVSVSTHQLADHYEITSTGYVPDVASPRETRTVRSVVNIVQGTPPFAVGAKEGITVAAGVTIKGDLRSNGQIELGNNCHIDPSEPGANDGSVYTSTGMASGVLIKGNLYMQPGREIKSRGPTNAELGGEDTADTGIWEESKIKGENILVVEKDTSLDTGKIDVYSSVDTTELGNMVEADYIYNDFVEYSSSTFNLNGKVHKFEEGVRFTSNITFEGAGTIWVSGGSGRDYGLELSQNAHGPGGPGDYAKVNLIVTGGDWNEAGIMIHQNVDINGLISGTMVHGDSNVNIKGVIESDGSINIDSNVTIHWGEIPFKVPLKKSEQKTIVKSWREL